MPVHPIDRGQRPWNKGLLIGQKRPLEPKHVWSIRVRLEIVRSWRDLVIFNLAIDSKLRACDLVKFSIRRYLLMRTALTHSPTTFVHNLGSRLRCVKCAKVAIHPG